jgi:hypothetical protein
MPPQSQALPRPTVSDQSVLREWITNCVGAKPPAPSGGAGGGAMSGDAGAGASNSMGG